MAPQRSFVVDAVARYLEGRVSDAEHLARKGVVAAPADSLSRAMLGLSLIDGPRQREGERLVLEADSGGCPVSGRVIRLVVDAAKGGAAVDVERAKRRAAELIAEVARFEDLRIRGEGGESEIVLVAMLDSGDPFRVRAACILASGYSYIVLLGRVQQAMRRCLETFPRDPAMLSGLGYACWSEGLFNEAVGFARDALRWAPGTLEMYRRLAMYQLTAGQHVEAFLTASAAYRIGDPGTADRMSGVLALAHQLMEGRDVVKLRFDGLDLAFHLTALNSMSLESDIYHLSGHPTEAEELKYCRTFAPKGGVVVEVGTLVGNHLVYFAKALAPSRIIAFDANPRMLDEVRRNLALNAVETPVDYHACAVGGRNGEISFGPLGTVPLVTLDDTVKVPASFYKIDVDGAELEVLAGMRRILREDKPRLMLEVDQVNFAKFAALLPELGYKIEHSISHGSYVNHFLIPV